MTDFNLKKLFYLDNPNLQRQFSLGHNPPKSSILAEKITNHEKQLNKKKGNNLKQPDQSLHHLENKKIDRTRDRNHKQSSKTNRQSSRSRSRDNHKSKLKHNPKQEHQYAKELSFYKTKLCPKYLNKKQCENGNKCNFAHGQHELKQMPNFFKTKLCINFQHNRCPYNSENCKYAHGQSQLKITNTNKKNQNLKQDKQSPIEYNLPYRINSFPQSSVPIPIHHTTNFVRNDLDYNYAKFAYTNEQIINNNFCQPYFNYVSIPDHQSTIYLPQSFSGYQNRYSQTGFPSYFDISFNASRVNYPPVQNSFVPVNNFQNNIYFQKHQKKSV